MEGELMESNNPKNEKKTDNKKKPKKIDRELVENVVELFFILSGSGKTTRR
jgi:hypothetical protein